MSNTVPSMVSKFEKIDLENINLITFLPVNSKEEYGLGPYIKSVNKNTIFPYTLVQECLLFQQEVDLSYWFIKS